MTKSQLPPTNPSTDHRVLVIDDSAVARQEVSRALQSSGLEVVEAAEGEEGLWRIRQQDVDLIVTDVHMPVMDGLAFTRRLRALPNYQSVPVLVLTSDCTEDRIQEGKVAGVTAWILKPPKLELLVATVRRALFKGKRRT